MNYQARQGAVRERMRSAKVDGLLLTHLPNIRYLTGFSGSNALLLMESQRTRLFTDGRYREQARQQVQAAEAIIPPRGDLIKAAAGRAGRLQRLGVEAQHLTVAQRKRWLGLWKGGAAGLRDASGWVEVLRSRKEPEEAAAIGRAVELASSVFAPTLRRMKPGMAETEAAGWLEFGLRRAGGEGTAFDTIIAGGARSALVHAQPSATPLPRRGFVVMDYGVVLGGYHSDMTRTVHVGEPGERVRRVYQAVLEAHMAALELVRPGVACAAVDRAARRELRRAGFGQYFPHSTGHGVGLEIHELPRLAATSKEVLEAGQVITIEPGVYIPGWGGVRIEDTVLVTASGAEVLTPTPKTLMLI